MPSCGADGGRPPLSVDGPLSGQHRAAGKGGATRSTTRGDLQPGHFLFYLHRYQEAVKQFEEAVELNPHDETMMAT